MLPNEFLFQSNFYFLIVMIMHFLVDFISLTKMVTDSMESSIMKHHH